MTDQNFDNLPKLIFEGTDPENSPSLNTLQYFLLQNIDYIEYFWWGVFFITLGIVAVKAVFYIPKERQQISSANHQTGLTAFYDRLFHIDEISQAPALKFLIAAVYIGFLVSFSSWMKDDGLTLAGIEKGYSMCWPFFQSCEDFIFTSATPYGYSHHIIYMALFGLIILGLWALAKSYHRLTHLCLLIIFLWAVYTVLISYNYNYAANYTYYLLGLSFLLLFSSHKQFFTSLLLVSFYFLSTVSKISDTWILGTYFTSLKIGLPLFPDAYAPVITNLVILMEMVFAWFLLSGHKTLQRSVFAFFVFFHLYSGLLVYYHYPTIVLPPLVILFGTLFVPFRAIPHLNTAKISWFFMVVVFAVHIIPYSIPGDRRITMEGNFYGLFMFEANHQCDVKVKRNNIELYGFVEANAHHRCDPYKIMKQAQKRLCDTHEAPLQLTILHSINGNPFYMIVDEDDLCTLTYKPFEKNEWIKDIDQAPAVSQPGKNYFK